MQFLLTNLEINLMVLLGIILILGLVGGEITRVSRFLPRIFGYILVGILIGPHGLNIINSTTLAKSRIFIDISLSLILFELGKNLDFVWLKHDKGLLRMSLAEISFTFTSVFIALHFLLDFELLSSAMGATIAISTSAAVVMMISHDLSSEGPVTRRSLILTSLNNCVGIILFTILTSLIKFSSPSNVKQIIETITYRLFGSIILGLITFFFLKFIANIIGKHRRNQFVLIIAIIILTLGLTRTFNLSAMLALFTLGVSARNLDFKHSLMEIDFGWWARIFFILLFVLVGAYLQFINIVQAAGAIFVFISLRLLSKMMGIWLFSKSSKLTNQQAIALGLSLFPMAGVAIGMSIKMLDYNAKLGYLLFTVMSGVIAILNIVGPIVTQFAFISTKEASPFDTRSKVQQ